MTFSLRPCNGVKLNEFSGQVNPLPLVTPEDVESFLSQFPLAFGEEFLYMSSSRKAWGYM